MSDKFIKYLVRKFTLLEHSLIMESLTKTNTSLPEIFFLRSIDVFRDGIMEICISERDFEDNQKRVLKCVRKDKIYIRKRLAKGLLQLKKLTDLPGDLPKRIQKMPEEEIIIELFRLRKKLFQFAGFIEFTHNLGKINIKLNEEELKKLGELHDNRRIALNKYLYYLNKVSISIAKKLKLKNRDVSYLFFHEIINLLRGSLSPSKADNLQKIRKQKFIIFYQNERAMLFAGKDFEKKLKTIKFKEDPLIKEEVAGFAIGRGIIRGKVKMVAPKMKLSEIPAGKIIVIPMTTPIMTPILKKSKAIVTDEGGLLCHAANVAREFGIIAIIGTKNATKCLRDGDWVEVDADNGVVKKIE